MAGRAHGGSLALVPVFGRLLETSERGLAAVRLADLAPASAGYADRLFALIEDTAPAEKRPFIGSGRLSNPPGEVPSAWSASRTSRCRPRSP
ncbi:hypothetical protein [Amycolatopsis plumensis]|uniref:Uncharacterized protein n=1 Tax=Amycolatopsis plumensis TaxID=236508 RepID=A0ABV5U4H2_9PSEU